MVEKRSVRGSAVKIKLSSKSNQQHLSLGILRKPWFGALRAGQFWAVAVIVILCTCSLLDGGRGLVTIFAFCHHSQTYSLVA
jgi:hypothetical protein